MKRIQTIAVAAACLAVGAMTLLAGGPPARAAVNTVYGPYVVTNVVATGGATISTAGGVYEVGSTAGAITVSGGTAANPVVLVLTGGTHSATTSRLALTGTANVVLYLAAGTTTTYACGNTSTVPSPTAHHAGVYVGLNATLTIEGTGALTATGGLYAAGIGGSYDTAAYAGDVMTDPNANGTVVISSGTVTATGGIGGAGIGGGLNGNGGHITINGGTVNATGGGAASGAGVTGGGGAGIGGGGNIGQSTAGSTGMSTGNQAAWAGWITITGGNITAKSLTGSAGIGGGFWAGDGIILISGGTINASAVSGGTGIGAGGRSTCGQLTITGGTITAAGTAQAAGIGNGTGVTGCDITISGGNIVATSAVTNASGIGGGADTSGHAGSATVVITGGNVYSANSAGQIRVNSNPSNGSTDGSQLVYAIIVQLQDANGNPVPNTSVTVPVSVGGYTYNYTATTDASGNAYLWLPSSDYKILFEDAAAGTYTDYFLHVAVPPNPDQYDPTTNIGVIRLVNNEPAWSLAEKVTTKLYGSAELDLNINHNNPCTNTLTTKATCSAGAIAGVKWYREDVTNPVNTIDTFDAGFAAASTANSGTDAGTGVDELNLQAGSTQNLKDFVMPITQNGRYWVQTHYIAMNTNLDVYTVTSIDVSNIYTPVTVSVRDVNAVTAAVIQGYTALTPNSPATQVGIPYDLDGSTLANPVDGFDTLTYARNSAAPAPRWTMALPGAPFAAATGTPETSVITLDSAANPTKADKGSTATALLYTVQYTDTDPATTLTVSKTVNGALADKTRAFDFAIWLQDDNGPITQTFDCTDHTGRPCADGPVVVTDGTGTFTLADGQSITLADVPLGAKVMVTETLVVGWAPSYTDSLAPQTIVQNNATPLEDMTDDRVFAFVNTRDAVPETGVTPGDVGNNLVLPIALVALLTSTYLGARALRGPHPMGARAMKRKGVAS